MTNGSLLNDLWVFDPVLKIWSQPAGHEINKPNKVAGHTANIVGDKLYVFGGKAFYPHLVVFSWFSVNKKKFCSQI